MFKFHKQITPKQLITRWGDILIKNSNYKGEVDKESFRLDWYFPTDADIGKKKLDWKNDEARKIREIVLHRLGNVNFDIVNKELDKYFEAVKLHLLNEGYIQLPNFDDKNWLLTDKGKLVKEIGGHEKYKKYKRTEITALTNQRKINNWLIAATFFAAVMPFVVAYVFPTKVIVNVPAQSHSDTAIIKTKQ